MKTNFPIIILSFLKKSFRYFANNRTKQLFLYKYIGY